MSACDGRCTAEMNSDKLRLHSLSREYAKQEKTHVYVPVHEQLWETSEIELYRMRESHA